MSKVGFLCAGCKSDGSRCGLLHEACEGLRVADSAEMGDYVHSVAVHILRTRPHLS